MERPAVRAACGAALFGLGLWTLIRDVPAWNALWYVFAWYGYLLALDALTQRLGGRSFLVERRAALFPLLFWSIPFWYLYELYNLALQNWYYVFVPRVEAWRLAMSFLAFATVLPACLFHEELVRARGWFARARLPPLRVTAGLEAALVAAGAASMVLPLVLPRETFWLVWGVTLFLPDVVSRRLGAPSLLADLEAGRPSRAMRLLAGGLIAGGAWEGLNYWARCKWIYTVPGLEESKLFEMPLLGFLGFPVLALGAFSSWSLLTHAVRAAPRGVFLAASAAALLFSFAAFEATEGRSVRSRRPALFELRGLGADEAERLVSAGVPTPEWLERVDAGGTLEAVSARSGLDAAVLRGAARHARLALHKGMGAGAAALLLDAGVENPAELARLDRRTLARRLHALALSRGMRPPSEAEISVWRRASRASGRPAR